MSAADSEESRWPDFATASIRTQSRRSTVAQRSSSAIEGFASTRSASFGGGLGSGTGLRCRHVGEVSGGAPSRAEAMGGPGRNRSPGFARQSKRAGVCAILGVRRFARTRLVWLAAAALATAAGVLVLSGDEEGGGPGSPPSSRASRPSRRTRPRGSSTSARDEPPRSDRQGTRAAVQEAVRSSPAPRLDPGQREVARVVRAYVAALDARDGGARLRAVRPRRPVGGRLPARPRDAAPRSLSASIGYRDPRGFPVYERSRVGADSRR